VTALRRLWQGAGAAAAIAGLAAIGCDTKTPAAPRGPAVQRSAQGGLFDSVADNLERLEQFDLNRMLPQIVDRLNQWYQQEKPTANWQLDPLVGQLPPELRSLPLIKTLDIVQFRLADAWYLQETVWMRDVSRMARGDQFEDVAVAERLFDWTVRNIQLDGPERTAKLQTHPHRAYEILLYGHGDASERAWIFMLLARQQGLDAVLLGLADENGANVRPWLPAVLSGGQLYLFDCQLGLPIPGPEGRSVATLAEVVADDGLLRQLDLDAEHPYPVRGDDLKHVVAFVEASPHSLSSRMALVESRLSGKRKLVLISPGTALMERVKKIEHVADAQAWPRPFEVWLWQSKLNEQQMQLASREMFVFEGIPSLLRGRSLYLKGVFDGDHGAKRYLLNSRPSNTAIENYKLDPQLARKIKKDAHSQVEAMYVVAMQQGKQDASYWLGLVAFEQKDFPTAIEFWDRFTLKVKPSSRWSPGARYNLGRTYEAQGDLERAVAMYQGEGQSAQGHGNLLRARRLQERNSGQPAASQAAQ
jgi:tetratricopeptide (TPR) repeat protein